MPTLVGLAIAVSVAWFAAEQHYDNCVAAATAATPLGEAGLTAADKAALPSQWDKYRVDADEILNPDESAANVAAVPDRPRERRERAIDGCSRVPW